MNLGQFFTPPWAAEAIVDKHFHRLGLSDMVIEPACGQAAFLKAIPSYVLAIGVEIDPAVAEIAIAESGREVIVGDFRTVEINAQPTLILGNPPFNLKVIDGFYDRAHAMLPEDGQVAFLLPAYAMQTAARVAGYSDRWSIFSEMIPRNIFPNLRLPLTFCILTKDNKRRFIGLALYLEAADALSLSAPYREALAATKGQVWKTVCNIALQQLGGKADLPAIYAEIERNRPSRTKFWRQKIRQTLRVYTTTFKAHGAGQYSIRGAA
jgi:hypothetical protein